MFIMRMCQGAVHVGRILHDLVEFAHEQVAFYPTRHRQSATTAPREGRAQDHNQISPPRGDKGSACILLGMRPDSFRRSLIGSSVSTLRYFEGVLYLASALARIRRACPPARLQKTRQSCRRGRPPGVMSPAMTCSRAPVAVGTLPVLPWMVSLPIAIIVSTSRA